VRMQSYGSASAATGWPDPSSAGRPARRQPRLTPAPPLGFECLSAVYAPLSHAASSFRRALPPRARVLPFAALVQSNSSKICYERQESLPRVPRQPALTSSQQIRTRPAPKQHR